MKNENPIEEIWRIRDELGSKGDYDAHRLFEGLRREESMYAQPPGARGTPPLIHQHRRVA
jgi:hypothetical protein